MNFNLETLLSGHVFAFMIVFTRLGAGLMMFPGIGEAFVTMRIRMLFALAMTFLVYPVLLPVLPAMPANPADLVLLVAGEILVGAFFGSVMRLLMGILETTGAVIGMNIGLSNAMILNPSLATQSALPAAFLGTASIVLVFSTGLSDLLFRALMDTYTVFPVAQDLPFGDMTQSFISLMMQTFVVAIQLSIPFMIMGLLVYVAMGIMQKLMPQIQLFLIILPAQIWGGLVIFSTCTGIILAQWLYFYDETVASLFIR